MKGVLVVIYGFVMAAGASRRFGDIKQLAKIDGVSMALRHTIYLTTS